MNGKKAKKIRKAFNPNKNMAKKEARMYAFMENGQLVSNPIRQSYQQAKKVFKNGIGIDLVMKVSRKK